MLRVILQLSVYGMEGAMLGMVALICPMLHLGQVAIVNDNCSAGKIKVT